MELKGRNLSSRMKGEDVKLLQEELAKLGFIIADEDGYFGKSTLDAVTVFQEKSGLQATGIVDQETVTMINLALESRNQDNTPKVSGYVFNLSGEGLAGKTVHVFTVNLAGAGMYDSVKKLTEIRRTPGFTSLGTGVTDSEGYYEVFVTIPESRVENAGRGNLVAYALKDDTIEGHSILLINKSKEKDAGIKNLTIILEQTDERGVSEYDWLMEKLQPYLDQNEARLFELNDEQVAFISGDVSLDIQKVGLLVDADKRREEYKDQKLSHRLFYGLGRQNILLKWVAIAMKKKAELKGAVSKSIEDNIIPFEEERGIKDFLGKIESIAMKDGLELSEDEDDVVVGKILNIALEDENLKARFLHYYCQFEGESGKFWQEYLPEQPEFKENPHLIQSLQLTNQLSILTLHHLSLIEELRQKREIRDLHDLCRISTEEWQTIIEKTGVPGDIEGSTDKEKADIYRETIQNLLNAAYPTKRIAFMVENQELKHTDENINQGLKAFFSKAGDFDISTSRVEDFEDVLSEAAPERKAEVKEHLKTMQRIYQVSPTPQAIATLLDNGITSAYHITTIPQTAFTEMYSDILGGDKIARTIYDRASYQVMRSHNTALTLYDVTSGLLPAATTYTPMRDTIKTVIGKHIPDWENLFGRSDICECAHCRSVYSPAAYFVDIMRFLEKSRQNDTHKTPLDILLNRRPDLAYIPLTCENTNTVIPYIDLVNEVLEYYTATDKLDAHTAHDTDGATMKELRAHPQYTMKEAYVKLKSSVYPFTLPYHQPLDVIRTYLKYLGTSRHAIMEAFDGNKTIAAKAEYLRLSEEEYKILTQKDFNGADALQSLWKYYGYTSEDELINSIVKVPEMLKRTGIKYTDLIELIKTRFINPHQVILHYIQSIFQGMDIHNAPLYDKLKKINAGTLLPENDDQIKQVLDKKGIPYNAFKDKIIADFEKLQKVMILFEPDSKCDPETTSLRALKSIYENSDDTEILKDTLAKIHPFIRLWHKTGWTIGELDMIISALAEKDITPGLIEKLYFVMTINDTLHQPLSSLACLWGAIDTNGDTSLYIKLFLKKSLQKINEAFLPDTFGRYLQDTTILLKDHLPAVLAGFKLSHTQLEAIAADAKITLAIAVLSIETLSIIYRYVVLARALKVKVTDFITLKNLFGIHPFSEWDGNTGEFIEIDPAKTLELVKIIRQVKEAGFKPQVLQYIVHGAVAAEVPVVLKEEKAFQAIMAIREGLIKIEQEHPLYREVEMTEEFLKSKVSLVFNEDITGQLIGTLHNTLFYSTVTEANLAIAIPGELQHKIKYLKARGIVQCYGVMTDDEKSILEGLAGATAGFKDAVTRIYEKPGEFIRENFGPIFTFRETDSVKAEMKINKAIQDLLDHPAQPSPLTVVQKQDIVYESLLPFLKHSLQENLVVQSIATALELDEPMVEILIKDSIENIIELLSMQGVSAKYYKDISFTQLGDERIDKEINFGWDINPPPAAITPGKFSVEWEGWICPAYNTEYIFIAEVEQADETVAFWVDGIHLFEKPAGDTRLSWEGVLGLSAGKLHKIRVAYSKNTQNAGIRLYWKSDTGSKEIIPAGICYPDSVVKECTERLGQFHRASLFIGEFDLKPGEIAYFKKHPTDFDTIDFTALTAMHWQRMNGYICLRNVLPQGPASLADIFEKAHKMTGDMDALLDFISDVTGWRRDMLSLLCDTTHYNLGENDFKNETALQKLHMAFTLEKKTGISGDTLFDWAKPETDFNTLYDMAQSVKRTVKAKYDEEDWLELAASLSDKIRENQKQALISHLLVQKPLPDWGVRDADSLFEYFLIDVQMGACMDTSRIKQAITSVQLFISRCLLNLESVKDATEKETGVSPDAIATKRWEWMKNYRIWEANRKVFLYPENWLNPELRDDKSPFFKELESDLLQNDITDRNVENACRRYLEKLDGVSNLEICGMYQHEETATVHIIARTHNSPHMYYYRTYNTDYKSWTAWKMVELDIRGIEDQEDSKDSGVHVIPLVWKNRLFLFWLEFMEKQKEKSEVGDTDINSLTLTTPNQLRPHTYWEARLAWSEFRDSKWTPKQITSEFVPLSGKKNYMFAVRTNIDKQIIDGTTIDGALSFYIDGHRRFFLTDIEGKFIITKHTFILGKKSFSAVSKTDLSTMAGKIAGTHAVEHVQDPGLGMEHISASALGNLSVVESSIQKKMSVLLSRISPYENFYVSGRTIDTYRLKLKKNDYLKKSRYHRLLYSHHIKDFEQTLHYPFFYQDNFRAYFVLPKDIRYFMQRFKKPSLAGFELLDQLKIKYEVKKVQDSTLLSSMDVHTIYKGIGIKPETKMDIDIMQGNTGISASSAEKRFEEIKNPVMSEMNRGTIPSMLASLETKAMDSHITKTDTMQMKSAEKIEKAFGGLHDPGKFVIVKKIRGIFDKGLRFYSFFHPYAGEFTSILNRGGIEALLAADTSLADDNGSFFKDEYEPNESYGFVQKPLPKINVDFGEKEENMFFYGPYSIYNWELFFHVPLFIATRLSKNGKYAEAMRWFHYIFNPTTSEKPEPDNPNARFWKVPPFKTTPLETVEDFLQSLKPNPDPENENPKIGEWRDNPFKPHLIARGRPLSYMKNVIICYIENLIDWGDDLFRRDTMESINEATQLYIIAAHILGPKPQFIPKRGEIKSETYESLRTGLDDFSNAMVQLENIFPFNSDITRPSTEFTINVPGIGNALYFCIPHNTRILTYWDTIADRLFKIRHCMNIEGVVRKLALFEPPIDPGLLVLAAAKGLSIGSILSDLNSPAPFYRFTYLLQKANEFCGEVKSLGNSLLSAIEKRDAEELSRLRAAHEMTLLELTKSIKERQVAEAKANKQSLVKNRDTADYRRKHYLELLGETYTDPPEIPEIEDTVTVDTELPDTEIKDVLPDVDVSLLDIEETGIKLIPRENEELVKNERANELQGKASSYEMIASVVSAIPNFSAEFEPFGAGGSISFGGSNLGSLNSALARFYQDNAADESHKGSVAAKMAGYIRREQDWILQVNLASREIIQLDKQIIAADIRIQIAEKELASHVQQMKNAEEITMFLKGETVGGYIKKFTTTELYQWMKEQLFSVYKQSYQLAYDMAKKAQKAYQFELGQPTASFIEYGYWESTYKGLCAGEKLQLDLRRMEKAYIEANAREFELRKHVSLALLHPRALMDLKNTGSCEIALPEELFDLDYPGHYFRRIKSISVTIPCIVGPYTIVNATIRLLKNEIRFTTNLNAEGKYERNNEEGIPIDDERFVQGRPPFKKMATSSAQNDSGMFELNFRDERYLPFEGAGVISTWKLELNGKYVIDGELKDFSQFDYDSISDVIMHIHYTSREAGGMFKEKTILYLGDYCEKIAENAPEPFMRMFSFKHEFPDSFYRLMETEGDTQKTDIEITKQHFPILFTNKNIRILKAEIFILPAAGKTDITVPDNIKLKEITTEQDVLEAASQGAWVKLPNTEIMKINLSLSDEDFSPIRKWSLEVNDTPDGFLKKDEIKDVVIFMKYSIVL